MNAEIGIVIPIGRFSQSLETTINSIIHQSVETKIAIFDASGDPRTRSLIDKFSQHFDYIHHGNDGGQSNAILMGWQRLNTDIVGWLNDDDHLGPHTLQAVIQTFKENPGCTAVYGPSVILADNGDYLGMHPEVNPKRLKEVFSNNMISQPSCFVKYDRIQAIGNINKDLEYTMDWDLWTRLLDKYPDSFVYSDDILSAVIFSDQTKTSTISLKRLGEIYALTRRYNPLGRSLKTVFSFLKWGVIQKHNSNRFNFYKSQLNPYSYWNYTKKISGIRLKGALNSEEINFILQHGNIILEASSKDQSKFIFENPISPKNLVKFNLKEIKFTSLDFIFEETRLNS